MLTLLYQYVFLLLMHAHNSKVMDEYHLGPNGGLVYCMEFLSKNFEWLSDKIMSMLEEDRYLLIDCPGQVIYLKTIRLALKAL